MRVSVLILTYNEEINLERCLNALRWCDDIVVVDSGSQDRTLEIATNHNAHILNRPFDNFANQRNFGLEQHDFKNEWVLHLDADEVATEAFVQALGQLDRDTNINAYRVPSKTMLLGKWLKHAGMWPTYQVRLGHKDNLRFVQVGHGQREDLPSEQVGTFGEAYEHYSFSHGMKRWLEKHIKYAQDEAELLIGYRAGVGDAIALGDDTASKRRRSKQKSAKIPFVLRPTARFAYVYLFRQGFRDGFRGLLYALMLSVYEGMTAILAYELMLSERLRSK